MKFDLTSLVSLGVLGLSGYAAYMLYTTQGSASVLDQGKYAIVLVLSAIYLGTNYYQQALSWFNNRPKSARCFNPQDFEEQDFKCLVHLRNRVTEAASQDGIETCEKLNTIIFGLHAKEKLANLKKSVNEKVTPK